MQVSGTQDLIGRMKGAAMLDVATYEEVEHDTSATTQALTVVILVSIASGIGSLGDNGISGLIGGAVNSVVSWAIFSFCVFWVGTKLIPAPETSADTGQVLRTLGFSYTPSLLAIVGFIPILGWIAVVVGAIWAFIAGIVAIHHALEMTILRALATMLIAFIPAAIVGLIVSAIFGINGF